MEAWRRVEVAAAEELDGPTAADLEGIRAATFTVAGRPGARGASPTTTSPRSSTCCSPARAPAGAGSTYGLTSSDVLDTALGLQLQAAGEIVVRGARELTAALVEQARAHVDTVCTGRTHGVHAEPTTFGVKLAGFAFEAHRNAERLQRAFAQASVGALSGAVGTYSATSPEFEAARARAPRPRARGRLHAGHPARPPRRAAAGDRARRRRPGAPGHRDPPPPAHRGPRGRGAVPLGGPEGLERDAPQAQPDHHRAHHRPGAHPARQRERGGGERRAVARARHQPLRRRAGDPARLDDPHRLHAGAGDARGLAGSSCTPTACAPTSTSRTARCSPSARCWRSWRAGWSATRPTGSSRRTPSTPGTTASRCATCSPPAISASTSTSCSTSRSSRATRPRSSRASTRST